MSEQSASTGVSQGSEASSIYVEYAPIIHLMRHAQSEHKPDGYETASPPKSEELSEFKDPKLTYKGETESIEFLDDFQKNATKITHILTSPLSRCLDTIKLALQDVLKKGVIVVPMAELQTLGGGNNATGLSVLDLRNKYESNTNTLQHNIDWRFLREDWNEGKDVAGNKGKWGGEEVEWRKNYVKGFLRGIVMTKKPGERMEILVVGHGSIFRALLGVGDLQWVGTEIKSYTFDTEGELQWEDDDEVIELRKGTQA